LDSENNNKNLVAPIDSLTEEQEKTLEKKIVWVFGSPRSGTTWLGTQLLSHKKNITWHEPYIGYHLGLFKKSWYKNRKEYFFSEYHKNNWLPFLRKLILARTFSLSQTLEKNIIIKEPNGSNSADIIMECFPNSKLIFLQRDGRDVVDSLMDTHQANSWSKQIPNLNRKPLETEIVKNEAIKKYSENWKEITNIVWETFKKHKPEFCLLVKYEDLIKDTHSNLKKIYQFLDVNIENSELNEIIERHDFKNIPSDQKGSGKFYRSASPGAWKNNFTTKEQELMNSIMSETLKQFEYQV